MILIFIKSSKLSKKNIEKLSWNYFMILIFLTSKVFRQSFANNESSMWRSNRITVGIKMVFLMIQCSFQNLLTTLLAHFIVQTVRIVAAEFNGRWFFNAEKWWKMEGTNPTPPHTPPSFLLLRWALIVKACYFIPSIYLNYKLVWRLHTSVGLIGIIL